MTRRRSASAKAAGGGGGDSSYGRPPVSDSKDAALDVVADVDDEERGDFAGAKPGKRAHAAKHEHKPTLKRTRTMSDGGGDESYDSEPEVPGSNAIVLHPGSLYFGFGFANDAYPHGVPSVVARRLWSAESVAAERALAGARAGRGNLSDPADPRWEALSEADVTDTSRPTRGGQSPSQQARSFNEHQKPRASRSERQPGHRLGGRVAQARTSWSARRAASTRRAKCLYWPIRRGRLITPWVARVCQPTLRNSSATTPGAAHQREARVRVIAVLLILTSTTACTSS